MSRRGKAVMIGAAVVVLGGVAILALTGNAPAPIQAIAERVIPADPEPCPLTGVVPAGEKAVPARPALAVKVENTPDAQPLVGLNDADIVYEEVVEGGITRFIAVFQCHQSPSVGPVRSARTTDPKTLLQFQAHPLLAFSGGAPRVVNDVVEMGVIPLTESSAPKAFERDAGRVAPHNLFAGTDKLWTAGQKAVSNEGAPRAVFVYDDEVPTPSKKATAATIEFSGLATAEWRWQQGSWVRHLDGAPMSLADGVPIATDNVVIQVVKVSESDIVDVAGYPSPEVEVVGSGKAWVLRNGKLIAGTWERASEGDITVFRTKKGEEIHLAPGSTFVELAPKGMFDAVIEFQP